MQINKLPKWAQEYIAKIERERDIAVRALRDYTDSTTESPFSVTTPECTGEQAGPSHIKRYIQAHTVDVEWRGVKLSISAHDYCADDGIRLQWETKRLGRDVAFIPMSYQCARLVAKECMRA